MKHRHASFTRWAIATMRTALKLRLALWSLMQLEAFLMAGITFTNGAIKFACHATTANCSMPISHISNPRSERALSR
ncbi:hypothetical protein F5882DRAFT_393894 [Hyaloscypha sp. PMI_1271]|nr:hypothetical protein F5882DRAFT_393894 [Hyaloscypha sp. PMI_1271]